MTLNVKNVHKLNKNCLQMPNLMVDCRSYTQMGLAQLKDLDINDSTKKTTCSKTNG
jgi:hypothetical protein